MHDSSILFLFAVFNLGISTNFVSCKLLSGQEARFGAFDSDNEFCGLFVLSAV